ncbi:MAG TPA: four helix bundle protein [Acidobacteriota bacterium]|nr:four helix bundle protein [Acidobacteriota bacterium]
MGACEFNVDLFACQFVRYIDERGGVQAAHYGLCRKVCAPGRAQPRSEFNSAIGRQWLRAATSVGANYRSACRRQVQPDFISKMTTVEEECDGSRYWMEPMVRAGAMKQQALDELMKEANEILSLVVASIRTARSRS